MAIFRQLSRYDYEPTCANCCILTTCTSKGRIAAAYWLRRNLSMSPRRFLAVIRVTASTLALAPVLIAQVGFLEAPQYRANADPSSMAAVSDLNGDGKLDLVLGNFDFPNTSVSVLLGNGDGSFQSARNYPIAGVPWGVAVGDFNGDGTPDIVTANENVSTASVLIGNGDGSSRPRWITRSEAILIRWPWATSTAMANLIL
jgi:hypothetical protein